MTLPPALWLGARSSGHTALNALAYPLVMLALVTMVLAYSRGAIAAAGIGCLLWFCFVPLRLRAVVVLASGAVGAVLVGVEGRMPHYPGRVEKMINGDEQPGR